MITQKITPSIWVETPFADYSVINSTDIYYTKQPIINQHCLLLVIVLLLLGVGLVIEFTRHGRVLALVLVHPAFCCPALFAPAKNGGKSAASAKSFREIDTSYSSISQNEAA